MVWLEGGQGEVRGACDGPTLGLGGMYPQNRPTCPPPPQHSRTPPHPLGNRDVDSQRIQFEFGEFAANSSGVQIHSEFAVNTSWRIRSANSLIVVSAPPLLHQRFFRTFVRPISPNSLRVKGSNFIEGSFIIKINYLSFQFAVWSDFGVPDR